MPPLKWAASYDFKERAWLDGYVKYRHAGPHAWTLQAGQFKQPIGLEELSSTRTGDFISKASATNTFALSRRIGAAFGASTGEAGLVAGVFGRTITWEDDPTEPSRGYAVRGYWSPLHDQDWVLHLGLSYAGLETDGDAARYRSRPNADLTAVRLVDSGELQRAGRQSLLGLEAMWLAKRMKVQGEYLQATVHGRGGVPEFTGEGWYVSGIWNLTGEAWGYRDGVPVTPEPARPRRGLWQAGVRYDRIDLNDAALRPATGAGLPAVVDGVLGGRMSLWTVGVNCYWRSHVKLMLNYVKARSERYSADSEAFVHDDPGIFEARVQVYW